MPIRVRLTAWYSLLLAAIIVGLGIFVVLQLRSDLRATVDREVRDGSGQITQGYSAEGREEFRDVARTVLPRRSGAAQVLDASGQVLLTNGQLVAEKPMVSVRARADALAGKSRLVTVRLGRDRQRYRVVVSPVERKGRREVIAVAESLQSVDDSVHRVLVLLLLAGPAALAATALGGWLLARRALSPVERMISEADEIGIDRLHERIAVPRAGDELSHLAATLNAMLDRLQRGVEEQHRLVADASHELRTPLAVMRSELDVSLRADDLSPDARTVLESNREEVGRMSRTVDNLLTLARVDEGRLELLKSRVNLRDGIEAAARALEPLAAAKRLRLAVNGGSYEAQADPQRLHQALTNFIENAIKFSQPGGAVNVTAWERGAEVGVTVADEGPGIPPDAREHIFDRFFRADAARGRDAGGSGLGLAICREVANAHGGRVWVESEEGKGSAFSLALPHNHE
jgi:heavy metal sensor kinase